MKNQKLLVSLVLAVFMFALLGSSVSAFATINSVEVDGQETIAGKAVAAVYAGETIPVRVTFLATEDASDVRIKAEILGENSYSVVTERFDVIKGESESRLFALQIPFDIDPNEYMDLEISVENRNKGTGDQEVVKLSAKRESYTVEVLDASVQSNVKAGEQLPLDIVLKNRGRHFAEDTFVKVRIPALGIESRNYFGDLSPVDQANPDKEDATERRMYLNIPSTAKPGVYAIEIEAYNGDSTTTVSKKVAVSGSVDESMVVSPLVSRTFAVGETAKYSLTLVNSGNKIKVYELVPETSSANFNADVEETVVVVPAGSSKSVNVNAYSKEEGKYSFAVNVVSNGDLVKKEIYAANVEGKKSSAGNTTVLVTVLLAIVFVVLIVVLIVLLTRKPEKKEFGESYY